MVQDDKNVKKPEEEEGDPRLDFIFGYATKSIRLKNDKWLKMLNTDEYMSILNTFFTTPLEKKLVLNISQAGTLVPFLGYPPDARTKSCFFIKAREEEVTKENYRALLIFGDVPPDPVDALFVLMEDILSPVLSNPRNRENWPNCVADDVLKRVHSFRSTVLEVRGKILGQTLLPMPVGVEKVEAEAEIVSKSRGRQVDLRLKSSIEGAVIKWAYLIEEVIREDSVKPLPGDHPGPLVEIDFWNKRMLNLENLYDQLRQSRTQKMAFILEKTGSMYYGTYELFFSRIVAGVQEARHVTAHLRPFIPMITRFEATDFVECEPHLEPILHCICLLWSRCSYYCVTHRILGFLQMLSNSVVSQAMKYVDPSSVFQADPEEMSASISKCLEILVRFRTSFRKFRNNLEEYFIKGNREFVPWSFPSKAAFQRTDDFIDRLTLLQSFFRDVLDFMKLDRVIIGGNKGRILSMKVAGVLEEFQKCWSVFTQSSYDPLDPDCPDFLSDYEKFKEASLDFDRRLAAIFIQAFDEIFDHTGLFKLLTMLGSLLNRPVIFKDIECKYDLIVNWVDSDLGHIKSSYDRRVAEYRRTGRMPVPRYYPPTAGIVCYIKGLEQKIEYPTSQIRLLNLPILGSPAMALVLEKQKEMLGLLHSLLDEVLEVFRQRAPVEAEWHLSKPLLRREDATLQLNFDPGLLAILREITYLHMLGPYDLPDNLVSLQRRSDELFFWVQCLNQLVIYYNEIRQKSKPVEFALFADEVEFIDVLIDSGIRLFNWNSPEAYTFMVKTRQLVKRLHARVSEAQKNTQEIYDLIFQWKDQPLFVRNTTSPHLLGLGDRLVKIKTRYSAIAEVGVEIHELVTLNYHLLLNIPLPEESLDGDEEEDEEEEEEGIEDEDEFYEGDDITEAEETAEEGNATVETKKKKRRKRLIADGDGDSIFNLPAEESEQPPFEEQTTSPVTKKPSTVMLKKSTKVTKKPKAKKSEKIEKYKKPKKGDRAKPEVASAPPSTARTGNNDNVATEEERHLQRLADKEDKWKDYVEYIDQVVVGGILTTISASVCYLLDETEPTAKKLPIYEIVLHLRVPDLLFEPQLRDEAPTGLPAIMSGILSDIYNIGTLIPRIAKHKEAKDYQLEADGCSDLRAMRTEICSRIKKVIKESQIYAESLLQYANIWTSSQETALEGFLLYGKTLTEEETDLYLQKLLVLPERKPSLEDFKNIIDFYHDLYLELDEKIASKMIFQSWLLVNCSPFKHGLLNTVSKWGYLYKNYLYNHALDSISGLEKFIKESDAILSIPVEEGDYNALVAVMGVLLSIRERTDATDEMFDPLWQMIEFLHDCDLDLPEDSRVALQELPDRWSNLKRMAIAVKQQIQPLVVAQVLLIKQKMALFEVRQNTYRSNFKMMQLFRSDCKNIYELLDKTNSELEELEKYQKGIEDQAALFEVPLTEAKDLAATRKDLVAVKNVWDLVNIIRSWFDEWKKSPWQKVDVEGMDQECKRFSKELRALDREVRSWEVYTDAEAMLRNMMTSLRAVTELQNPAIQERHWRELMMATKVRFVMSPTTTLADLLDLQLHKFEEEVKTIVDKSVKEMSMEKTLRELEQTWKNFSFDKALHARTNTTVLAASEELIETLENDQNQLQNLMSSKFIGYFITEVSKWQDRLSTADQVISIWMEVQRSWQHLESIFIGSEDIRSQLPEDTKRFEQINTMFKELLNEMMKDLNVVRATNRSGLYEKLDYLQKELVQCEKALADYLETKRLVYPRFYFVSSSDLLDILSTGNQPELVCRHLTKLYDSLAKLHFNQGTKIARGMHAKDGEYVPFSGTCDCSGKVEVWLNRVTDIMRKTLRVNFGEAVGAYDEKPRDQFLLDFPAQTALVATQIWWNAEVLMAFEKLGEGYEGAMKDYNRKQVQQLSILISMLLGDLTRGDRQKIMTICTIDVHSRDVIAKIIQMRVDHMSAFQWQSQLRHRWDTKQKDCFANICDAQFRYDYEYLGCTPRLVITPLTDRCYITLTQSLRLIMGGAPAGPAGTGKTETTKDLGRALGYMVYVFNCSEQMDYKSCGNIYKGLAQTGAWGCFDEFNRISVEVLSVIAVQVKTVQDAIKAKKQRFNFMGENINLIPTVGIFITMNPGYAGRAELPENLKALFRPCAMVVPDFELICEIMLVAEGFQDARLLARKFITLYTLCRELLSKQDHYDWGLRAIKSVLVVAGSLKRGDRQRAEDQVLMRALRDFNIPKIVTDDLPVFMGLIGDLFPALDVPRKRDVEFEKMIKSSCIEMKLQPEDNFVLKCVQLEELFEVRHSVFIIGFAGTGKTQVWKSLMKTYANQKRKPWYNDLNPKAVTADELFGAINPATREWKDGLFSVIMRDQANMTGDGPKWIVLDGDIDPMWIESLNTLMDDNKVLTLASNERIALTPAMRLLFEISNLRTATPATVSRAGILYINPADLGWNPYVTSWVDTRKNESEKVQLMILFDKYVSGCLDALKSKLKKVTPLPEINHVQILCHLLDCLLTPTNLPDDCPKEWYEIYFVFACVWAFGAAMFQDQLVDWRNEFSKWFVSEFKTVRFPSGSNVFGYYIDHETKQFMPWGNMVPEFEFDAEIPLQNMVVATAETTRIRYLMDLLLEKRVPIMLVGGAGTGKTVVVADKMARLPEEFAVTNVPFNFYTTSEMLQKALEKPLEKKAGRNFGPPGNKKMIYVIDDMNMPEVDTYGTVQPHTLIRQHIDYNHWYDRTKLTLKEIHNCQYVASMNPTAGSFTIDPRLQRHFAVFAVSMPSGDALHSIYENILKGHLTQHAYKFSPGLFKILTPLISAALLLHQRLGVTFLPTAIKFHYIFNMRDLTNIFQGLLFSTPECIPTASSLVKLWVHEATRVYGDKLVEEKDIKTFNTLIREVATKGFEGVAEGDVFVEPLLYCHFAEGIGENKYMPVATWEEMNKLLIEALSQYNDLVAAMNLVLFEDAMHHVCRINRILEAPRGNALLVGVGGSGKQSLARLAAFISSLEVFQIQLRKGYSMVDLKADMAQQYMKTGIKNIGVVFLMTDAQVADERFLVCINDCLASGEIAELFADDEVDNIINGVRNEVKGAGLEDNKDNCWKFFIDKVRRSLKVVLCFSPVGATLRVRARKFPAVVNCTAINWFHEWPHEALVSVSARFLAMIKELPEQYVDSVSRFMAHVHTTVNEASEEYLSTERRYNYTTPKSFLEQISLYGKLLASKVSENQERIYKLENGLTKLVSTANQVDALKETLAAQEVILSEKNAAADAIVQVVSAESAKVAAEKAVAAEEEEKVRVIEEDVTVKQRICEDDLRKAEPALVAAQAALDTLDKNNLTEYKSFGTPPPGCEDVAAAVMVLFAKGKIPRMQDRTWKNAKIMMGKTDDFLNNLKNYDKENMNPEAVKQCQFYVNQAQFDPEKIKTKSSAAAGLCSWVINILKFYEVFKDVEPKRIALKQANAELDDARSKLSFLKAKLKNLEEKLGKLTAEFDVAMEAKMKCQAEADATSLAINLAHRLVNGLSSESVRWRESVQTLKLVLSTLPGDILLPTAFISYLGCFTRRYRVRLIEKEWIPFIRAVEPAIPMSQDVDHLSMLTDDAQIAEWNNQGLPGDSMSIENATILVNSSRWPLMIDPQLQGIKWIKNKYGDELKVVRLGQKSYMDVIETAISEGSTVLIEYIEETVDAVLEPLLSRALIRKGQAIKIGDKEIDFNPAFRLILQTKLANPHYQPEMQAQATLINFTVTRDGLEEQLLGEVVKAERPDLEELKTSLTQQQNTFKITLKGLEEDLLNRLSAAGDDIVGDVALVNNLETTKATAAEITKKVAEAKITAVKLDEAREQYRPVAARASLLYFVLNDLNKINPIYQFSLKAFSIVFNKAIMGTGEAQNLKERVVMLLDSVTYCVYLYTNRALFEQDKIIFASQMAIQILLAAGEIENEELDFLLRYPASPAATCPLDFMTLQGWGGIKQLSTLIEFKNLDRDIEASAKRWRKIVESEKPELEKLPQDWKSKNALQRLCVMRCLRPDRMTYAMLTFIEEKLGTKYAESRGIPLSQSFEESTPLTPIFFILSAGVDPSKDVETLGRRLGFSIDRRNLHNVSLGQGQEVVAEEAMELASREGHWVILQNVHLVKKWLPTLEKKMEQCQEGAHDRYRLFITAEPAPAPEYHIIPQGILESAIKITNEPPTGMLANMHKALDLFSQSVLESCSKEAEFKAILFSLCYFHAVVAERRKFGAQGWNRVYPFNNGDLTISVSVLYNYLESSNKIPWEDLRYLFGEIMYGGHITDDWDRRLCRTYLEECMRPELLDGELLLCAGFPAPPNLDYQGYHHYIDTALPAESPSHYGLHINAEIGFLSTLSENLFRTLFEMQPRDAAKGEGGMVMTREDKVKMIVDDIMDKAPEEFNIPEMMARVEDKTPYVLVAFQELERMNILFREIKRSLRELDLGLKGELTISTDMETLMAGLFLDQVPPTWSKLAYPSVLPLGGWLVDLIARLRELENWSMDFSLPPSVWLSGFFNPQSFLTAIMQSTARKNEWPLDKMCLFCEVTKKSREEITTAMREGACVHGLVMEGARWDTQLNCIVDSRVKELYPPMPVIAIRAITQDKQEIRGIYECPLYKTKQRGPTFVWTFNLKTREKPGKWTLAGVALLLST